MGTQARATVGGEASLTLRLVMTLLRKCQVNTVLYYSSATSMAGLGGDSTGL